MSFPNCDFYDGNATADNMYYGQHVIGCTFNKLVKVQEYYEANATLPEVFENNLWTNIVSNPLSIVGSLTLINPQPFIIRSNILYGVPNINQISFTPAENVTIVSNIFYGPSTGIAFTGVGLQPSDGTASYCSNIVISCNSFNDTFLPVSISQFNGVFNVIVTNNTSSGGYEFAQGGNWISNIVFAANVGPATVSNPTSPGQYFKDLPGNYFGVVGNGDQDYAGTTNIITYAVGRWHTIAHEMPNSAYYMDDSHPKFIPVGATLQITNYGGLTTPVYLGTNLSKSPIYLTNNFLLTAYWNGTFLTTNGAPIIQVKPGSLSARDHPHWDGSNE